MDKFRRRKKNRAVAKHSVDYGLPLGIHDMNGTELYIGDIIRWYQGDTYVVCIILFNSNYKTIDAMVRNSMRYGDNMYNMYDENSYGKSYQIPMDDGARMQIEKIV